MIPNHAATHSLSSGGIADSVSFGLSIDDSAHLMHILRDTMYSDRILAVLREYASNAWDAHRDAGKHDVPIKITLPTDEDMTLSIRDYGAGLSHDGVFKVFTQYGKSTKRNSDGTVGMLGIGSKSGFAYSDTFTVTSCYQGERRVYIAVLDETNMGRMNLVHTEECKDETGVEIKIAVKPEDVGDFQTKARALFLHMQPRPDINIVLPDAPTKRTVLTNGYVDLVDYEGYSYNAGTWTAVMGCVPYRIQLDQLDLCEMHSKILRRTSGVLPFAIGALQISASREDLKYSAMTKAAVTAKVTALVDEFVTHVLADLEKSTLSKFNQRLKVIALHKIGFEIPGEWESLSKSTVKLFDDADKSLLYLVRDSSVTNTVTVTDNTKLYIDDAGRDLRGYRDLRNPSTYVVRISLRDKHGVPIERKKNTPLTPEQLALLQAELTKHIDACELTGIPMQLLSTVTYDELLFKKKRSGGGGGYNNKHRATMFQYTGKVSSTKSESWEIVTREPQDDDVFVIIESFAAYNSFRQDYVNDERICEALGVTMPKVYGYKSTEKKPVEEADCTGVEYRAWRDDFVKSLLNDTTRQLVSDVHWVTTFSDYLSPDTLNRLARRIGENHCIVEALRTSKTISERISTSVRDQIITFGCRVGLAREQSTAMTLLRSIHETYPLLALNDGISQLWTAGYYVDKLVARKRIKAWTHYVKMVDTATAAIADDADDEQQQLAS